MPEVKEQDQQVAKPEGALPPPQMRERRDSPSGEKMSNQPTLSGTEAVGVLKNDGELSTQNQLSALDWFLSPEPDVQTKVISLNVGNDREPVWIDWTIRAVDLDQLRAIQKRLSDNAAKRGRLQGTDDIDSLVEVIVEGTVDPPLREAAAQLGIRTPDEAVKKRFAHKSGLIPSIAQQIFALSGYDDEDVREASAAGN